MKRGLQWNTLILSAGPLMQKSSLQRYLPAKAPGDPTLGAQILQTQILSGSSLLRNWLHFPEETGITSKMKPRTGKSFARGLMLGQPLFDGYYMGQIAR